MSSPDLSTVHRASVCRGSPFESSPAFLRPARPPRIGNIGAAVLSTSPDSAQSDGLRIASASDAPSGSGSRSGGRWPGTRPRTRPVPRRGREGVEALRGYVNRSLWIPNQAAPFPKRTAGIVLTSSLKSPHRLQVSMYSTSSFVHSSKGIVLRPLTCQIHVIPGRMERRRL